MYNAYLYNDAGELWRIEEVDSLIALLRMPDPNEPSRAIAFQVVEQDLNVYGAVRLIYRQVECDGVLP
jgi:hypothetical protein